MPQPDAPQFPAEPSLRRPPPAASRHITLPPPTLALPMDSPAPALAAPPVPAQSPPLPDHPLEAAAALLPTLDAEAAAGHVPSAAAASLIRRLARTPDPAPPSQLEAAALRLARLAAAQEAQLVALQRMLEQLL